jgi:hypothetical protein
MRKVDGCLNHVFLLLEIGERMNKKINGEMILEEMAFSSFALLFIGNSIEIFHKNILYQAFRLGSIELIKDMESFIVNLQ